MNFKEGEKGMSELIFKPNDFATEPVHEHDISVAERDELKVTVERAADELDDYALLVEALYVERDTLKAENERLKLAMKDAKEFISGKIVCLGKRHDCPSCDGHDAQYTMEQIDQHLAGGEGEK